MEMCFGMGVVIEPLGENKINVKSEENNLTPNIQKRFTNKKLTTKSLDNDAKETVFHILNKVAFYDIKNTRIKFK